MTPSQFDALVDELDHQFQNRPRSLRRATFLWILIGYLGFLSVFLMFLAFCAVLLSGLVAIDTVAGVMLAGGAVLLLLILVLQIGMMLWIPWTEPEGIRLSAAGQPELFQTIERIRAAGDATKQRRVYLTMEYNAAGAESSRLAPLGFSSPVLILGLPLMESLTRPQFEAVIAHELAHGSNRDGGFTAWAYRVRASWARAFGQMQKPAGDSLEILWRRLVGWYFNWYWPRFNARAMLLSRSCEYAADRRAAEWSSPQDIANALWAIRCIGARLEDEFWQDVRQTAAATSEPPGDICTQLAEALKKPPAPVLARRWMNVAAATLTNNENSHPSTADRLGALGESIEGRLAGGFPLAPQRSAAAELLGSELTPLRAELSAKWKKDTMLAWGAMHNVARDSRPKVETAPIQSIAEVEKLWSAVQKRLSIESFEACQSDLRTILELAPDHAGASFALGSHLLERLNPEGEAVLRKLLAKSHQAYESAALERLAHHYETTGNAEALREVRLAMSRTQEEGRLAQKERSTVIATDSFIPHDLDEAALNALCEKLKENETLFDAALVRKELRYRVHEKLFVLAVRTKPRRWRGSHPDRDHELIEKLIRAIKLPGRVLIVGPHGPFAKVYLGVWKQPGAAILEQPDG